jgi:glycosyltransferase involved in cell wall biosynthesis
MKIKPCFKIFDFADDYIAMLKQELGKFGNPLIYKVGQNLLDKMVEKSDLTLVISKVLADSINNTDKSKIKIIPNGVDLDDMECSGGGEIRQKYPKPIIGFIGSFEYFIDFDIILETAARLKDYTFLLVGSGRKFEEVKNKTAEMGLKNVVLTGGVPHHEISGYVDSMDICLNIFKKIPISHGASPIKLFEYLAMKKPVISTRLREVENIDKGFLFYADTSLELEERIKEVIANKALTENMIEKGYNIVKNDFSWKNITENLLNAIKLNRQRV